jgi:hypothetical protein
MPVQFPFKQRKKLPEQLDGYCYSTNVGERSSVPEERPIVLGETKAALANDGDKLLWFVIYALFAIAGFSSCVIG